MISQDIGAVLRGVGEPGVPVVAALAAVLLGACGGGSSPKGSSSTAPTTSTAPTSSRPLRILVTNDDGVGAPGIDAVVQGLRSLPGTQVTVVAPAGNESGTGSRTTPGTLATSPASTASGYPATAVHGYPADTVIWSIDHHGIPTRPDLVVSGINFGQNIGPLAGASGTVGAALAAVRRGVPALAASQGIDDGAQPDFAEGVAQVKAWVQSHHQALVDHSYGTSLPQGNLNVPTCPNGRVRGPVTAPLAMTLTGRSILSVDCNSTSNAFTDDAGAFVLGFAVISPL